MPITMTISRLDEFMRVVAADAAPEPPSAGDAPGMPRVARPREAAAEETGRTGSIDAEHVNAGEE